MPLMGLNVIKPKIEQDINTILQDAYKLQFLGNGGAANDMVKNLVDDAAKNFADQASKGVVEAILKFLKEIKIDITLTPTIIAPPVPPMFPGGPATGNILSSNIQIL